MRFSKAFRGGLDKQKRCVKIRVKLFFKNLVMQGASSYVSFTNNRTERNLRMSKVKQKVSECFRKELDDKVYYQISSYLQTMENKGHNPLITIQMALAGEITECGI